MASSSGNDINILQTSDSGVVDAGAGNDKYILSAANIGPNKVIKIGDSLGTNTLQLIGGLTIASSKIASDTVELTLSNGAVVTVLNASTFSYEIAGDPLSGTAGTVQTYTQFATTTLGAASVPTGSTIVTGTPNQVIAGGTTGGGAALTLTADAVTLAEPAQVTAGTNTTANMTFTVKLSAAQTTDTVVNYATSTATGDLATANSDYTTTNGSLTIPAGATSATFTVPVIGDGVFDGTVANPTAQEKFTVTLSSPTSAFATSTVKGIINDLQTNALPTQTIPAAGANILMGSSATIGTGISVADADNNNVKVVLTASNGLMSTAATGAITAQNGLRTMTLEGSKTDVNNALAAMTYSSDRTIAGVDTITMVTTDPLGGTSTTGTITVNVNAGGTFATATGGEAFTGTAGNDYYTGTQTNIETTDTLAAGSGTADTLSITAVTTAALGQATAFTGLEIVNVTTTAGAARTATLDVAKAGTDVKTITFTDGDGATTVTTDDDNFAVTNLNTGSTVTINNIVTALELAQVAASSTVTLALAGGVKTGTMTSSANPATTFNIQSNGSAANEITSATTAFSATTNVAITGSAALKLTTGDAAGPLTINGGTATGALTIDNAASTTAATVITGGFAADSITGSSTIASTLSGGDGNDTLTGGAGADSITGGAGDDSINGGTGADSLTGGTGKDTYTVNETGDKVVLIAGDTGTVAAGTADVISGIVEGVKVDLSAYYTGAVSTFLADGNLAVATAGASSTLRDIYIDSAKKAIVIEMDATGTTTQEISIGVAANATVANVGGVLTFGAVPMTSYVSGNTIVVEGQSPNNATTVTADLSTSIPQVYVTGTATNVAGATTSFANVDLSKLVGATGTVVTGSSVSNTIVGSGLADGITGGGGADTMTGGAGVDTFRISTIATSTSATAANVVKITDFVAGTDKINFAQGALALTDVTTDGMGDAVATMAGVVTNSTSVATLADVYTQLATYTTLTASAAAGTATVAQVYSFTTGAAAGTYLVVNDATIGFQAATDVVINVTGVTGTISAADFTFAV